MPYLPHSEDRLVMPLGTIRVRMVHVLPGDPGWRKPWASAYWQVEKRVVAEVPRRRPNLPREVVEPWRPIVGTMDRGEAFRIAKELRVHHKKGQA